MSMEGTTSFVELDFSFILFHPTTLLASETGFHTTSHSWELRSSMSWYVTYYIVQSIVQMSGVCVTLLTWLLQCWE